MTPLLERCATLGKEFVRRGMTTNAANLRRFYRRVRDGKPPEPEGWTEAFVDTWLATLQLPPFEHVYEVREKSPTSGCTVCPDTPALESRNRTDCVFPGGARFKCERCGQRWLELD